MRCRLPLRGWRSQRRAPRGDVAVGGSPREQRSHRGDGLDGSDGAEVGAGPEHLVEVDQPERDCADVDQAANTTRAIRVAGASAVADFRETEVVGMAGGAGRSGDGVQPDRSGDGEGADDRQEDAATGAVEGGEEHHGGLPGRERLPARSN